MSASTQGQLIRKQFLVSESNIAKLEEIASKRGTSAAEIVRQAIEAFDPDRADILEAPELMDLVSHRLREAIKSTQRANRKVAKTLRALGNKEE